MKHKKKLNLDVAQDETADIKHVCLLTSRVVYIHPARRYYTVEFRSPITGYNWREAFWPELAPLFKAVSTAV